MKRFFSIVALLALFAGNLRADEGMWMLPFLKQMNAAQLAKAGCQLSPEQIYSINHSSLKDAIVHFGSGCTGEIISSNGLLVTNHHCGYGSIQKLSSVEHDYLKNGYWAMNHSEELPCEGLTVTFMDKMVDITAQVKKIQKKAEKKYEGQEKAQALITKEVETSISELIAKEEKKNPHSEIIVESYYNNNMYFMIYNRVFKDIRFVGAPPSSIGKFGADTDNWMWPRHTGDFSMFRVYADKDNNPAEYSKDNVPYQTKNFLKISLDGVKEGDYTMIMGYPGRTTRFQTSPELKNQIALNDVRIAARTIRQNDMLEEMLADPAVKIQYASKYSRSSNGWKKWQGMKLAFAKLGIIERAEQEEADFMTWVNANKKRQTEYGQVLEDIKSSVEASGSAEKAMTLAFESIYKIELPIFSLMFKAGFNESLANGLDENAALMESYNNLLPQYKDFSLKVDKKVFKSLMEFYRAHANEEDMLHGPIEDFKTLDIDTLSEKLYSESVFTTPEKLKNAIETMGINVMQDPIVAIGLEINKITGVALNRARSMKGNLASAQELYTKALLEWKKGQPSYPDANSTMRLTYGSVKGYSPADAIQYRYYTTLDGVMEKEDPNNWEFVVEPELKELWKNKDFGQYAMPDGKMPVAFLSNNDITGGNSGSPIMNAKGELLGLAFDGNWESMSSDVMFEPDLQRCINVDIRYVLFVVEKFGGAKWLIDEIELVKTK